MRIYCHWIYTSQMLKREFFMLKGNDTSWKFEPTRRNKEHRREKMHVNQYKNIFSNFKLTKAK